MSSTVHVHVHVHVPIHAQVHVLLYRAMESLTSQHLSMQIKAFYNAVSAMTLKEGVRSMLQVSFLPTTCTCMSKWTSHIICPPPHFPSFSALWSGQAETQYNGHWL